MRGVRMSGATVPNYSGVVCRCGHEITGRVLERWQFARDFPGVIARDVNTPAPREPECKSCHGLRSAAHHKARSDVVERARRVVFYDASDAADADSQYDDAVRGLAVSLRVMDGIGRMEVAP